jgi:hypothetical protein
MNTVEILLRAIQERVLLGPDTFENEKLEAALSGRDAPAFELKWLQLFERVKDIDLAEDEAAGLDQLRESAFRTTFKHSADPELSSYISNDFEVIAKGIIRGQEDAFLNAMLEAYASGRIPHGALLSSTTSARSLMDLLHRRK